MQGCIHDGGRKGRSCSLGSHPDSLGPTSRMEQALGAG